MNAADNPDLLPGQAVELLTRFNRMGMAGPTMTPSQATTALAGLTALLRVAPNALRHVSSHLLTTQRQGMLTDVKGGDTDELVERIRQRTFDSFALLEEVADSLDKALTLAQRFRSGPPTPLTAASQRRGA
ncbi:hypothetical protein [Streptomyces sp. TLI_171]|uniref:hypothetical protein n=1 Tax=Streptomyces sp. TLI_171 TaxID=1938859 RepID=UPI000C1A2CF4|nr:hypothetical protein [Streptomyces sp. TLI_171]RKE02964.1 hypothetical protein BX266_7568 [Streptomyces sp. TLI_171]